jgi:ectoine hydroxylase-related dioxygenase (phytanoyl-CoA dioxygenase family)
LRLRAILHDGHEQPVNASAYVVHRDTWYAHPSASFGAWIPLFDVTEEETFFLYPRFFDRPVLPNDSETFEYAAGAAIARDREVAKSHREAGRTIETPESATGLDLGPRLGFSARRGEVLLFSSAHLHATQRNASGRTRFSVDCRLVDLVDHANGLGAPNADARCRGDASVDYVRCAAGS